MGNTRDRILNAAESRLLAMGPAGLVLDAVAADAGISKGGLLYHFPSKEALVEGAELRVVDEVLACAEHADLDELHVVRPAQTGHDLVDDREMECGLGCGGHCDERTQGRGQDRASDASRLVEQSLHRILRTDGGSEL